MEREALLRSWYDLDLRGRGEAICLNFKHKIDFKVSCKIGIFPRMLDRPGKLTYPRLDVQFLSQLARQGATCAFAWFDVTTRQELVVCVLRMCQENIFAIANNGASEIVKVGTQVRSPSSVPNKSQSIWNIRPDYTT